MRIVAILDRVDLMMNPPLVKNSFRRAVIRSPARSIADSRPRGVASLGRPDLSVVAHLHDVPEHLFRIEVVELIRVDLPALDDGDAARPEAFQRGAAIVVVQLQVVEPFALFLQVFVVDAASRQRLHQLELHIRPPRDGQEIRVGARAGPAPWSRGRPGEQRYRRPTGRSGRFPSTVSWLRRGPERHGPPG